MAKSDSFFIRAEVETDDSNFVQTEIDLGSFVNLGISKSTIMRIHNIEVQYSDSGGVEAPQYSLAAGGGRICWQVTTQTQATSSTMLRLTDKSLVASGSLTLYGDPNSTAHAISGNDVLDVGPQSWRNGYLIAVDTLYLGAEVGATVSSGNAYVSIVMECTLENATQASSTALALSQQ